MFYEVKEIEMNGEKIPYRMDNLVLQEIQSKYETTTNFLYKLMGYGEKDGKVQRIAEPSAKAVNDIFPAMVREGYACKNRECPYEDAEIIRAIDKPMIQMAVLIQEEFLACFAGKKKETKIAPKKKMPGKR